MKNLRKTKIIGTIGPASESEEMLTKLMKAGLNVCRINFSHGGYEENATKIETIKKCRDKLNLPIAMCLDTKGPEIRTGVLESGDEKVTVNEGQDFVFVNEDIIGNNTKTTLSFKDLYKDVKPGSFILVNDGQVELLVDHIEGEDIYTVAANSGRVKNKRGINVPGTALQFDFLSEKDKSDLTRKNISKLTKNIDKSKFVIDLNHQPNDYDNESRANIDLVLSGHTHGGQLLPITMFVGKSSFNDRKYGLEKRGNTTFIVNSGISDWALDFKTGTKSEYGVIDIIKK